MHKYRLFFFILLFAAFTLSCGKDDSSDPEPWYTIERSDTFSGTTPEVFLVDTPGNVNLTYTLDLGTSTRDVYFIFTNSTMSDASSNPVVASQFNSIDPFAEDASTGIDSDYTPASYIQAREEPDENTIALRGTPEITEFNRDPFGHISAEPILNIEPQRSISVSIPSYDTSGGTGTFYDDVGNTISATCRKVITDGSITVNIWVANDSWSVCSKTSCVDQTMVDELAKKFLISDPDNDVYDWLTAIYGIEWGSHSYPTQLISDNNEISILLYDIAHSNVLGFYFSRDNFFRKTSDSVLKYSNERIMFYLDSVLYATETGISWEITDAWPSEIISTLAHEFQHMIHFYQKTVLQAGGSGTETWLNELLSLVSEDLVAYYIEVDGPRGVAFDDPTAGSSNNIAGRLPRYNFNNYISLVTWKDDSLDDLLNNYSINYAFGAYLARSFGGAPFMRNLLLNGYTDYRAIDYALQKTGHSDENFTSVMRKWAAANLLSDTTTLTDSDYTYNSGTWFKSTQGEEYFLGSIDLYNYKYSGLTGPRIFTSSPVGPGTSQPHASNYYYLVGKNLTGEISRTITMEKEIKLTVVVK